MMLMSFEMLAYGCSFAALDVDFLESRANSPI